MKLFTLLAGCAALAHAAKDVAEAGFEDASDADVMTWKNDVLDAAATTKDITNKSCQVPKGKNIKKMGDPSKVKKNLYKLSNGNTRSTYVYQFKDGTIVYAGNSNVGQKGGMWKIYCYRQGKDVATKSPHNQGDLSSTMTQKLRTIFKNIDRDGSGTITTGGAYTGLSQIFPSYSLPNFEATLEKESIRAAGKDKVVDMDEFECVAKKLYNIQKVYSEFKQYDKNTDLKMDRKELESALIKFYFKDVAKPGLIQTAAARAQVKKTVDAIIQRHDANNDGSVSWQEFEMDAFMEEHYNLGAKCATSKTPLNKHAVSVIESLIKKFNKKGTKMEISQSSWYQITSMLTETAIDMVNGSDKAPALGCRKKTMTGPQKVPSGGVHSTDHAPGLLGGRVRLLQQKPTTGATGTGANKEKMSVMQALKALRKDADTNNDHMISDHEILDNFQGVADHLSASDFGIFLDMVNKITGPVNCGLKKECGTCTAVKNAGLCGWFTEAKTGGGSFGGATMSKGNCKFVDRSKNAENNPGSDSARAITCNGICPGAKKPTNVRGGNPRLI